MMDVYVAIGSNIEPEVMLRRAAVRLRETFSTVNFSPVYRNPSVGFDGDDFLNTVGHFITGMSADGVDKQLKAIQFELDPRSAKPTNCKIGVLEAAMFDTLPFSCCFPALSVLCPGRARPVQAWPGLAWLVQARVGRAWCGPG